MPGATGPAFTHSVSPWMAPANALTPIAFQPGPFRITDVRNARQSAAPPRRSVRSVTAAPEIISTASSPGFNEALSRYESTNSTSARGAIRDFIGSQTARETARSALRADIRDVLDFPASVKTQLAGILRTLTGRSIDPDKVFLNRFDIFGRPSRLDLPKNEFARTRLAQSQSLTELAIALASHEWSLPTEEGLVLDLGLYTRRTGTQEYLPREEVPGLKAASLVEALRGADFQKNFAKRISEFWSATVPAYGNNQNKFEIFRSAMAENEARLQFAVGQLSAQGLRIAQTLIEYPTHSQRSEVDIDPSGMCTHSLMVDGSDGQKYAPSGMYAVSEYPEHWNGGGVTLLYTAGSASPYREYASIAAMLTALSPGTTNETAREDLIERLPLRAAIVEPKGGWLPVLPGMQNDVVAFGLQSTIDNLADDFSYVSALQATTSRASDRSGQWMRWLTGADAPTIETTWSQSARKSGSRYEGQVRMETIRQLSELADLRADVSANNPDLRLGAWTYVRDTVRKRFGVEVDPDQTFLNTFDAPIPPNRSVIQTQNTARLISSTSLTDRILAELSGNAGQEIGNRYTGVYTQNAGSDSRTRIALQPSELLETLNHKDLATLYRTQLDTFWTTKSDSMRKVLKGNFVIDTFMLRLGPSLTDAGAAIAMRVASLDEAAFDRLDLSGIHNSADTPPKGIQASWLDIHGYVSTMPMFTDTSGTILLYVPIAEGNTIHAFANTIELHDWVREQASDPAKRSRFLESFAMRDIDDGALYSGVDTALTGIADGTWATSCINRKNSPIDGDPFEAVTNAMHQLMLSDADSSIYSDSERRITTWMQRLGVVNMAIGVGAIVVPPLAGPALALAAVQIVAGGLEASQTDPHRSKQGWRSVGEGVLNGALGLATLKASGQAAARGLKRYATDVPLRRMTPMSPGIYRYGDKRFAAVDGDLYAIEYDHGARSWRLSDSTAAGHEGPGIRQGNDYTWELRSLDDLSGVIDELRTDGLDPVMDRETVERTYRSKLASLKSSSDASRRKSYEDAVELARQSPSAPDWLGDSVAMKKDFIHPQMTDLRQLGVLSRWIEEAERLEQTALATKNADVIAADIRGAGGRFEPLPQSTYVNTNGDGKTGFCLPLCRVMAVAIKEGRSASLIGNIARAIGHPKSAEALALRNSLIQLHSKVEANVAVGETCVLDINAMVGLLHRSNAPSVYLVGTRRHTMIIGLQAEADGTVARYFYDPNFGLARFGSRQPFETTFEKVLGTHLVGRKLGTLYESFGTASRPLFTVQKIDLTALGALKVGDYDVAGLSAPWSEASLPDSGVA
jgi:hypothetical protein